jgi:hypothetical protein
MKPMKALLKRGTSMQQLTIFSDALAQQGAFLKSGEEEGRYYVVFDADVIPDWVIANLGM